MRSEDRDAVKLQEGVATGNRKPLAHFPARLLGSSLSLSPSTVSHSPETVTDGCGSYQFCVRAV